MSRVRIVLTLHRGFGLGFSITDTMVVVVALCLSVEINFHNDHMSHKRFEWYNEWKDGGA